MTTELVLTGIDGMNPLGFMAALGLLKVLETRRSPGAARPRLAWRDEGRWRPVVETTLSLAAIIETVIVELRSWSDDPALGIVDGSEGCEPEDDLKPAPERYRAFLMHVARLAVGGPGRPAKFAASFASELVTDNGGNTKPTAFHFTAGQQKFLTMVRTLLAEVSADDLQEALVGPWTGASRLPSLSWDATVARNYALRANDPSGEKRGSVPGADVLAFIGLSFFPVTANSRVELQTCCVRGGWKTGRFTWLLWKPLATADVVRSILVDPSLEESKPHERRARGIVVVLQSAILRSEQGGYGSFTPPEVV